jgi:predicted PurR-regulated permease PerM
LDGVLPFKDAFLSTFVIILVAGVIGLIFNIILWKVIDPELASKIKDELINNMTAFMEKNNVPDDQLDEAIAKIEERDMDSIVAQLKNFLYSNVIGGGVISLIVAAVIKKNKEDL